MILVSIIALIAAINLGRGLLPRLGRWNASLAGASAYVVVVAAAMYVLPPVNEVPADFSAAVLWNFRLAAIGMQIVLWTTLGVVFGLVAERSVSALRLSSAAPGR
jgi:hypothetical protein